MADVVTPLVKARVMPTPAERSPRFDELDAYRGFAALLIVVYHAYDAYAPTLRPFAGGALDPILIRLSTSVGWFFALSGFVIFLPFARAALSGQKSPAIHTFLARRLLRLVPLYYCALVIVWLMANSGSAWERNDLLLHLAFLQVYSPAHYFGILAPAWSLAVEIHFYLIVALIAPPLCYACARLQTARGRLLTVLIPLIMLILSSLGYRLATAASTDLGHPASPPISFLDGFALGMGLATLVAFIRQRAILPRRAIVPLRLIGVATCGLHIIIPKHSVLEQQLALLPAAAGFTLIMASTVLGARETQWTRLLTSPLPSWLGAQSYGIYLWHVPIIKLLVAFGLAFSASALSFGPSLALLLGLTVVLSILGHRYVERPAMQLRHRLLAQAQPAPPAPPAPPPSLAALTAPASLCGERKSKQSKDAPIRIITERQ